MKLNVIYQALIVLIASVAIMIYLESILVPFIFSVIVWFLIRGLRKLFVKIPGIGKLFPAWALNVVAFITIIGAIFAIGSIVVNNVNEMINQWPKYKNNIQLVVQELNSTLGIDLFNEVQDYIYHLNVTDLAKSVLNSVSAFVSDIFLVILYVIFLMSEERLIPTKLKNSYRNMENYKKAKQIITEVNDSISNYISLKTILSLITAIASYIALISIDVDFAIFWAILIFILNFIPTIGSLFATLFPALMALLQYAEFTPFILVITIVGSIQVVVGNFLEPKMMKSSLNISSLVVILSLSFWGLLWGIMGMLLSVPVTVILIIIFSKIQATRAIAVWLSGNGEMK